jgi:two-component system NtrC family sensor kinase
MRYVLLLAGLWLLGQAASATAAVSIDSAGVLVRRLLPRGLLLSEGWKYRLGDDPNWAQPDFDDSGWDTLHPARPRRELPLSLQTSVSWLRLRFRLSDSLRQQTLVLQAWELGACEIYLNGQLVLRQGTLAANPARVRPRGVNMPPGEVPAAGPAEQVLAVRYAPWQPPLLFGLGLRPQLQLRLFTPRQYWAYVARAQASFSVFLVAIGFFGLLTLLHLAFYHYNPAQRANRYFARFTLALALAFLSGYCGSVLPYFTQASFLTVDILTNALGPMGSLWAVRALYALFNLRPGRLYAALWASYGAMLLVLVLGHYHPAHTIAQTLVTVLAAAEQLRLTAGALRRYRGVWIIAAGFAGGLLAALVILTLLRLGVLLKLEANAVLLGNLLAVLMYLLPALGISLFLSREFALDSQLLQVKLGEVERLSVQTLAQEQDKQALLAAQNEMLDQQVQHRTGELQRSLLELRTTQAQLIQKEKMASLGELTAGIAHEIQNPLNFVNNFSEVSAELVAELREERSKGSTADTELEAELLDDLDKNLGKIHQHGQRAASIVRGMLEHSHQSTGERTCVDINALCEEYLRLAYHGLRAKDKTFNAELKTEFAPGLAPVEGVGADLGRVLLNLFNNAFYAVRQRAQTGELGYEPTVEVSTRQVDQQLEICVRDNGTGMRPEVQQKIFQPFFTTKPTGEGTGLGLSLSHDIIAQGHGGSLRVESQVGQGSTFHVRLPTRQVE